jgi:hypothetical protein
VSWGCLGGGGLRAGLVGVLAGCAMAGCSAQCWPASCWPGVTRGAGRPPVGAGWSAACDGARVCRWARGAVVSARCAVPGVVFVPYSAGLRLALLFRLAAFVLKL